MKIAFGVEKERAAALVAADDRLARAVLAVAQLGREVADSFGGTYTREGGETMALVDGEALADLRAACKEWKAASGAAHRAIRGVESAHDPRGVCPGCGGVALDGHITCGDLRCNEAGRR